MSKILIFSIIISQHSSEFQISQENKISSLNCFFIDNLPVIQMKSVNWGKKGEVFDKPQGERTVNVCMILGFRTF